MADVNIIIKCQEIHDEMKKNYDSCKESIDTEIIQAFLELNDIQIEVIENLSKLALTGPQKQKCYYTLAHLKHLLSLFFIFIHVCLLFW